MRKILSDAEYDARTRRPGAPTLLSPEGIVTFRDALRREIDNPIHVKGGLEFDSLAIGDNIGLIFNVLRNGDTAIPYYSHVGDDAQVINGDVTLIHVEPDIPFFFEGIRSDEIIMSHTRSRYVLMAMIVNTGQSHFVVRYKTDRWYEYDDLIPDLHPNFNTCKEGLVRFQDVVENARYQLQLYVLEA